MVRGWVRRAGEETLSDVEGSEEDCFEHFIGFVGIHMPCRQCD